MCVCVYIYIYIFYAIVMLFLYYRNQWKNSAECSMTQFAKKSEESRDCSFAPFQKVVTIAIHMSQWNNFLVRNGWSSH